MNSSILLLLIITETTNKPKKEEGNHRRQSSSWSLPDNDWSKYIRATKNSYESWKFFKTKVE